MFQFEPSSQTQVRGSFPAGLEGVHVTPSPVKPELHVQVKLPGVVSAHVAFGSQFAVAHPSIGVHAKPSPV
jgi:hypothetical protein